MTGRRTWFGRRFELGFPLDAFPDILKGVRATPIRLEERVAGLFVVVLSLVATVTAQAQVAFHTSPADWGEPRFFHSPFEPHYSDRVRIERLPGRSIEAVAVSPNRAYRVGIEPVSDCTRDGLGVTGCSSSAVNLDLLVDTERDYLLAIRVRDRYPNFIVSFRWTNEKLLWVRVWWGRILGTDVVVDVESENLIYREMVHDGTLAFQQYQQRE